MGMADVGVSTRLSRNDPPRVEETRVMHRWIPALVLAAVAYASAAAAADTSPAPQGLLQRGAPAQIGQTPSPSPGSDAYLLPSPMTGQRGVQVRTNILSGKTFEAGSTIDYWPSAAHPETPAVAARRDETTPVELGGFVGYLFHDQAADRRPSSLGLDLQVATDPQSAAGGWLVQPGLDYSTALAPSWHLSTRLFSTYAPDGYSSGPFGPERTGALRSGGSGSDATFQDVGVGLGLGYSLDEKWNIQTQARYQRMLGAGESAGPETAPHQFFGGVMVDYKF
jgi:MltA-interacting protein MipA